MDIKLLNAIKLAAKYGFEMAEAIDKAKEARVKWDQAMGRVEFLLRKEPIIKEGGIK